MTARRARDHDGNPIEPMDLANMRQLGVRTVEAECQQCLHQADVNVDTLSGTVYVPDVALKLRCSECGSKDIVTRPRWMDSPVHRAD